MNEIGEENKPSTGFIIIRYVNSHLTNNYWIKCYEGIREFYPENDIVIIDDHSNSEYLTAIDMYKTTIINSEYPPKRGELLPYIYYLKNKFFDVAVIIQDAIFIQKHLDLTVDNYKLLWSFHGHQDKDKEEKIIQIFNDDELLNLHRNTSLWSGCFGGMTIITHDYLSFIHNKYDINKLLDVVFDRFQRMYFERVLACLLQANCKAEVLLGKIDDYCEWGISYEQKDNYKHLPWLKVWSGR